MPTMPHYTEPLQLLESGSDDEEETPGLEDFVPDPTVLYAPVESYDPIHPDTDLNIKKIKT